MPHTPSYINNGDVQNFGPVDITVAEDLNNWSFPPVAGESLTSLGGNYYDDDDARVNFSVTLPTAYIESNNWNNNYFAPGYSSRDSLFSVELERGENVASALSKVPLALPRAESYNFLQKISQQFQHPTYNNANNLNYAPHAVINIPELTEKEQIIPSSNIVTSHAPITSLDDISSCSPSQDLAFTISATSGVSPSPESDVDINEKDVIFGRGFGPAKHIGNQAFRHFTMKYKENYVSSKKQSRQAAGNSKMMLTCRIYETWVSIGGRFMEKVIDSEGNKCMVEVPQKKCMKKIGMALRQKQHWKRVEANGKAKNIALEAGVFMDTFL